MRQMRTKFLSIKACDPINQSLAMLSLLITSLQNHCFPIGRSCELPKVPSVHWPCRRPNRAHRSQEPYNLCSHCVTVTDSVNANFCIYYAKEPSCTQNHGSDAYGWTRSQQTTREANDHRRHCERKSRIVCEHSILPNRLTNPVGKVRLKSFVSFLFLGTHFRIFVGKLPVHLRGCTHISSKASATAASIAP